MVFNFEWSTAGGGVGWGAVGFGCIFWFEDFEVEEEETTKCFG